MSHSGFYSTGLPGPFNLNYKISLHAGGGIWLMRGAYGSGILGTSMQTVGTFLSGYLYKI
jgi:hypothetical protein